jgi:hypothetical protein
MKTFLKFNRNSRINGFAAITIALIAAASLVGCGKASATDQESVTKTHESTAEVSKATSAKLTDEQQQAINFAKRYSGARLGESKNSVLHGVQAVQLRVVLVTSDAMATLSESKVVGAATQTLKSVGVQVVESDGAPILILSVDTLDLGSALTFNVRLELIEEVVLARQSEFLKTMVKSWDTSQFGGALKADAGEYLSTAVLKALKKFADGLREGN